MDSQQTTFLAVHNMYGSIRAVIVAPADAPRPAITLQSDECITEIDAPDVPFDLADPYSYGTLAELHENFRVEVEPTRARLVRTTRAESD